MTSATSTTQPQRGGPQLTLRFRKGTDLLAWYQQLADHNGVSLTEALLVGLDFYRAAHDNGGLTLNTAHDGRNHLA
jgi:hypothetical protein